MRSPRVSARTALPLLILPALLIGSIQCAGGIARRGPAVAPAAPDASPAASDASSAPTDASLAASVPSPAPENIIILIADGWGYDAIDAARFWSGGSEAPAYLGWPVQLALFTGSDTTRYDPGAAWSDFEYVKLRATDSAAAATALSTGVKTRDGAIGVDRDGNRLTHLSEVAEAMGKSSGVVTTVPLSHATPAGFTAHSLARSEYEEIARQMLFDSRLDVLIGCGDPGYDEDGLPVAEPGEHGYVGGEVVWAGLLVGATEFDVDGDGVVDFTVKDAGSRGVFDGKPDPWRLIRDREEFVSTADGLAPDRLLGVPRVHSTLRSERSGDRFADPHVVPVNPEIPNLQELTRAALNVLDDNPSGFFLMIEGGAIDWAAHANASGRLIEEMIDFHDAVRAVVDWVEMQSDWNRTLVIVTGDHETGYVTGPGSGGNPPVWNPITDAGPGVLPGMEWHSTKHTNRLVPFYARGAGSQLFPSRAGLVDPRRGPVLCNTEVAKTCRWLWEESNGDAMRRSTLSRHQDRLLPE